MGYNTASYEVRVRLSSHNDERDKRDEALWEELCQRIADLAADPRYAAIAPFTS
jgi:hypothetical protein